MLVLVAGYFDLAMKTALQLRDYEDVIDEQEAYALLALASAANRDFNACSKAFIKLESLDGDKYQDARQQYEELAMEIFTRCARCFLYDLTELM